MTTYCSRHAHPRRIVLIIATLVLGQPCVVHINAGTTSPSPTPSATAAIKIVDIIPKSLSGETDFNVEPYLSINPANPLQIAASFWATEPLGGPTTPIFISSDGGETWTCLSTIPGVPQTADKTVQYGGLLKMVYLATCVQKPTNNNYNLQVWRSEQPGLTWTSAEYRDGIMDQPFINSLTANQKDRVFVGYYNWHSPHKKTAFVDRSLDGTISNNFSPLSIEFDHPLFDSSEIRPAISADGQKVYAAFNRVSSVHGAVRVGDVIVVRDDNGGNSGGLSFKALKDQNGVPGFTVIKKRTFLFDVDGYPALLGGDRLGGDLAIAVDPNRPDTIYLVWGNVINHQPTLHLIRGDSGGTTWSKNDLFTVTNAKNPSVAVNANGTVAFLYQQVTTDSRNGETWNTQIVMAKTDFQNAKVITLAQFPATELAGIPGQPLLGDYLHLIAMGYDFYGIFSSSNVPDYNRFPCLATSQCQVTFQRTADFSAQKLLGLNGDQVTSSMDPFFFKVSGQ